MPWHDQKIVPKTVKLVYKYELIILSRLLLSSMNVSTGTCFFLQFQTHFLAFAHLLW